MTDKRRDQTETERDKAGSSARDAGDEKEPSPRRDQGRMTDDERIDEASEDSFPASDPPSQP
jgi:hypothetical protein